MKDLQAWLERVKLAEHGRQIFQILDEFRPIDWTDEQRALMSRTYIAALAKVDAGALNDEQKDRPKTPVGSPADQQEEILDSTVESETLIDAESVWYEKM